ncbi:MAG: hypothetical protein R2838_06260 [Caldilineaceae bacterium]
MSSVQKVTSTAYGNAMMLVQQNGANQLYTYTSPYLYKTSPSYVPIANGLVIQHPQVTAGSGLTYVNVGTGIVALDSHTNQELWSALLPNARRMRRRGLRSGAAVDLRNRQCADALCIGCEHGR